jgi:hypothetical protein
MRFAHCARPGVGGNGSSGSRAAFPTTLAARPLYPRQRTTFCSAEVDRVGPKAVIRRPHIGRFWWRKGPIVSIGQARDILHLNFCTENPRESDLPELVRAIMHPPLRSPGARFTLARRRS